LVINISWLKNTPARDETALFAEEGRKHIPKYEVEPMEWGVGKDDAERSIAFCGRRVAQCHWRW